MEEKSRRGGLVGPLILIGLGLIFLLNNLGISTLSVWEVIFRLWPLFLIAIGVDLLVGRRSVWGSLVTLALILVIFAAGYWLFWVRSEKGEAVTSERISQPLEGATRARISIGRDAGMVKISALRESARLVEGVLQRVERERVTQDFSVKGGTATFELKGKWQGAVPHIGKGEKQAWDVGLNPSIPLELKVGLAVGESEVDLTGLKISNLDVGMAVGDTRVVLPSKGDLEAKIGGVIGNVEVLIPEGMEARIRVGTLVGQRALPSGYMRQDNVYTSAGYERATNRVNLEVGNVVGNVSIRQIKE